MLDNFTRLAATLKPNRIYTESIVFYVQTKLSFLLLLFCCILVCSEFFWKERIQCIEERASQISSDFLNPYCLATSTYSVKLAYLKQVEVQIPHAGIMGSENEMYYEYRNYYQYIHFVLLVQALLFYLPHFVVKLSYPYLFSEMLEKIKNSELEGGDQFGECLKSISKQIRNKWGTHKLMVWGYYTCQILATLNIMLQICLLNIFFQGKFISLGLSFDLYYKSDISSDPLELFPLVTACHFNFYGPSGHIDVIDTMCILPMNALNGKIFLYIWIWLAFLLILSTSSLICLTLWMLIPRCRIFWLRFCSTVFRSKPVDNKSYLELAACGDAGDLFLLSSLKRGMNEKTFYDITPLLLSEVNPDLRSIETEERA